MNGEVPYKDISNAEKITGITSGTISLEVRDYWPEVLKSLLQKTWSRKPNRRPSFKQIYGILDKELNVLDDPCGDDLG